MLHCLYLTLTLLENMDRNESKTQDSDANGNSEQEGGYLSIHFCFIYLFCLTLIYNNHSGGVCIICFENQVDCVFLECGHISCCKICGDKMNQCPICRRPIARVVKVFLSAK